MRESVPLKLFKIVRRDSQKTDLTKKKIEKIFKKLCSQNIFYVWSNAFYFHKIKTNIFQMNIALLALFVKRSIFAAIVIIFLDFYCTSADATPKRSLQYFASVAKRINFYSSWIRRKTQKTIGLLMVAEVIDVK